MIKLFTMVKDEVDIIKEWIIYHGCLFGWQNIFIIDNDSTDGTFEIIQEFAHLINVYQKSDYKLKGQYMQELIQEHCSDKSIAIPIAIPIDIDEFIIYYDKENNKINTDRDFIINYILQLKPASVYKMNYINPINTCEDGYDQAIKMLEYGSYADYDNLAKSFINTSLFTGKIDHGNHIICENYLLTNICLIHYHSRNINQLKKKILNNIIGLGYPNNIDALTEIITKNNICPGNHHVKNQIMVLNNTFRFKSVKVLDIDNLINLVEFTIKIKYGYY